MDNNLLKKLFCVDGLSYSDKASSVEVQNRLAEVLAGRAFCLNTPYQSRNVINDRHDVSTCTFYDSLSERNPSLFSDTFCKEYPDWKFECLNLSDEADYNTWNTYSGFTFDVYELYIIGYAMRLCLGDIEDLTDEDIELAIEILMESYDEDLDSDDLVDPAEMKESVVLLLDDIREAKKTKVTTNSYLQTMAEDFSRLFGNLISVENVFCSIDEILQFCFGICEGTVRSLLVLGNKNISHYLMNKKHFSEEEQSLIDAAIQCISHPLNEENGIFLDCMYPFVTQDENWFTVFIPIGCSNMGNVTERHMRPFMYEAAKTISTLLTQ